MSIRIGTNVASISAQNALNKTLEKRDSALQSLATGKRIVNSKDDAAGLAISEKLRAQKRGLAASQRNAQDAISFVQVAEGSLNEQNNILIRMRELGIQAASDTISDTERGFLNKEFQALSQELDRIAHTSQYAGHKLLTGEGEDFEFQVGTGNTDMDQIRFRLDADATASSLNIEDLDISEQDDALDSLENLDKALNQVTEMRAEFGSVQSRLQTAANHILTQHENIAEAHSNLADADIAHEAAELAQANVLADIGVAVLAQANTQPYQAGRLIMNL